MIATRKVTLQLTPLLDLLLIVIFAQYLEVRTTHTEVAKRHSAELDQLQKNVSAVRDSNQWLEQELTEARTRHGDVISALRGLFAVPDGDLANLERHLDPNIAGLTSKELTVLRERLKTLANARGPEIIHHLLTFEELRKRCDIWDLYITDQGLFRLTVNDRFYEFRAENPEQFATQLAETAAALPEPKMQVLIVLSYGDTKLLIRQAAITGISPALDSIRNYRGNGIRYEYALLGYRAASSP